jgi:hypothetical protein
MRRPLAVLLTSALALTLSTASAQDDDAPPDPEVVKDASTPAYLKAVELQRKGKFKEAQKAFRDVVAKWPESIHKDDCERRGGDNCYMGCTKFIDNGPPATRIDVSVMGDGFQIEDAQMKMEEDWARLCVKVLESEYAYSEYAKYFNFYFVRLVSKDQGVDEVLSPEEQKKREESAGKKGKRKKYKDPKEFSTALDCKAAGPQKQVMSDPDLVWQWLEYANHDAPGCGENGLVIVFARFGALGMAQMDNGLANCGQPSNSVTVHEFGHAFVGLYDEYANNPGPPGIEIRGINATTNPKDVPWKHFLDKKVKGVDVLEGGATFKKGVWRPAHGCAMNSAGAGSGYCPVCREAAILKVYALVNPIDDVGPDPKREVRCVDGDESKIVVTPMRPMKHDLECEWYVDRMMESEAGPSKPVSDGTTTDVIAVSKGSKGARPRAVDRAAYDSPPFGFPSDLGKKEGSWAKGDTRFVLPTGKLGRGRWQVTCRVWDPTDQVLKDEQHLLEERETWFVTVAPKK